jgi:hypothetical protein
MLTFPQTCVNKLKLENTVNESTHWAVTHHRVQQTENVRINKPRIRKKYGEANNKMTQSLTTFFLEESKDTNNIVLLICFYFSCICCSLWEATSRSTTNVDARLYRTWSFILCSQQPALSRNGRACSIITGQCREWPKGADIVDNGHMICDVGRIRSLTVKHTHTHTYIYKLEICQLKRTKLLYNWRNLHKKQEKK